ncbi:MAG TPA: hypothetical protein VFY12_00240 [Arenimonas sp.]|nr:hypothetical protein [Arenimonas sp.]
MATRPAGRKVSKTAAALLTPDAGVEARLHTACVKAGAGAAWQVALTYLPLLKPFLPDAVREAGKADSAEVIQRRLIQSIYRSYTLKPAAWEIEGILAVAQTQANLSPLASRAGLDALLRSWLPDAISVPLLRYTLLEPLVTATSRAIAATWAAGRYADSVCRLRKAGADWLPAPLAEALNLAPSTLRAWSAEALSVALPPLRLASSLGRRFAESLTPAPAIKPAPRKTARKRVTKSAPRKAR